MTEQQKAAIKKVAEELKALPHDEFMRLLSEAGESDLAAIMRELLKPQPAQDNQEAAEQAAEKFASGPSGNHDKSWTFEMLRDGFLAGDANGYARAKAEDRENCAALIAQIRHRDAEINALKQQVAELEKELKIQDEANEILTRREREAVAETVPDEGTGIKKFHDELSAAAYSEEKLRRENIKLAALANQNANSCKGLSEEIDRLRSDLIEAEADKAALQAEVERLTGYIEKMYNKVADQYSDDAPPSRWEEEFEQLYIDATGAAFPSPEVKS